MSILLAIAKREFLSFFLLPVGWIVISLFLLLTGGVFAGAILGPGQPATLRPFFAIAGWLMLPVVPAVSMRLFSEEIRTGSIETLLAAPVRDGVMVLGKFLGAAMFLVAMLLPTAAYRHGDAALNRAHLHDIACAHHHLVQFDHFGDFGVGGDQRHILTGQVDQHAKSGAVRRAGDGRTHPGIKEIDVGTGVAPVHPHTHGGRVHRHAAFAHSAHRHLGVHVANGRDQLNRAGVFKIERDGDLVAGHKRLLQPDQHDVQSTRFQQQEAVCRDDEAAFDRAHLHDIALSHDHLVQLHHFGGVGTGAHQRIGHVADVDQLTVDCAVGHRRFGGAHPGIEQIRDMTFLVVREGGGWEEETQRDEDQQDTITLHVALL